MSSPLNRMRPAVTSYSGEPSSVVASVDLPEPLGPMMAWTSPAATVRSTPGQDLGAALGGARPQALDLEEGAQRTCAQVY